MKKIFLYVLSLMPLSCLAQISGEPIPNGYYRVMNVGTSRYMSVVDNKAQPVQIVSGNAKVDLGAIKMLSDFDENVVHNPATLCYVEHKGGNFYNLKSHGLDLYEVTGRQLQAFEKSTGNYWIYASVSGISRYIYDSTLGKNENPLVSNTPEGVLADNYRWKIYPVDQTFYFGVKPDIQATSDNSYWAVLYASFPYKASDPAMKFYTVSKVDYNLGYAVIKEIEGDVAPQTPVLVRCAGATPSANKTTLLDPNTTGSYGTNYLIGNYYCNDVTGYHRNVTDFDNSKMRILGLSDGKPAFVKSDISYVPANKCYLAVNSSAPDNLVIVTEAEYATGIHELNVNSTTVGAKVIYDLQGRHVTTPAKGLYIVNGKKVIIK